MTEGSKQPDQQAGPEVHEGSPLPADSLSANGETAPAAAPETSGAQARQQTTAAPPGSDSNKVGSAPMAPPVVVQHRGGHALALTALLLLLLLIGGSSGLLGWFIYTGADPLDYVSIPTIEKFRTRIDELEENLANAHLSTRLARERETALRKDLEAMGEALNERITQLASQAPINAREWRIAEVAYLLRIASLRAGTEGDRTGAEALLAAADTLLRELDDFGLLPVRERIAEARVQLRTTPAVDRSGLYLELEAISNVIAALPLELREFRSTPMSEAEQRGDWVDTLRERFAGLIDFRVHRPTPVRALVRPDEAELVRHSLLLKIEQAQLALLRKDGEIWRLALTDSQRWLRDYFAHESEATQSLLRILERLADEQIMVKAPDISAPYAELMRLHGRTTFLDPVPEP